MGVYPAKNGRWSYLHCNFPNHRAAALSVLGVPEDREAVRAGRGDSGTRSSWRRRSSPPRAPAAWCARMDEWAQHPQAAAIASLPLMEIVKIGDSPPEPLPARRPAALRHPRARPDARPGRADLRPHAGRARRRRDEDHRRRTCRISATRNTTPATASSRPSSTCASRRTSRRCAGWSARPTCSRRATGRARSASAACRPRNWRELRPGLVYVSLCAFSHVGPWASRRGFDTVVQTVSGITSAPGRAVPRQGAGPAILPGLGDRLPDRLPDGVRRDGGAGAPRARGRQLAGAHLAGPDRALAGRAAARCRRPSCKDVPKEFTAEELERWSIDERDAGRPAAAPAAGRAAFRDAAALGAAVGAARLPRAGLAGAGLDARPAARDTDHPR